MSLAVDLSLEDFPGVTCIQVQSSFLTHSLDFVSENHFCGYKVLTIFTLFEFEGL